MAETVFILGAGASKEAGAPLMKDFLSKAQEVAPSDELNIVMRGVKKFSRTHSKWPIYGGNLEEVFAAFEMASVLNRFPGMNRDDVEKLVPAMRTVIEDTLDKTVHFHATSKSDQPRAPRAYIEFVRLMSAIRARSQEEQGVAIITFNYDIALDCALWNFGDSANYALGDSKGNVPLFKLHGSLNWAECRGCGKVVPWSMEDYFSKSRWTSSNENRTVNIPITKQIKEDFVHCGKPCEVAPFVVPPTWNKSGHYGSIASVWEAAANALADAENIFIIGYSMPNTDMFFRYLMALSTAEDTLMKRFWVFNPDPEVEKKILAELGYGSKPAFKFFKEEFGQAIKTLRKEFPSPNQTSGPSTRRRVGWARFAGL